MAELSTNAPRWAIHRLVHKLGALVPRGRRRKGVLPHLSDHMARDMGLSPNELELHRLRLPSEVYRHPML